jgi:hypothetical protein
MLIPKAGIAGVSVQNSLRRICATRTPQHGVSLNANFLVVFRTVLERAPTSPFKCTPKTAVDCLRATSTLREGSKVTCCSIAT